MKDICGTQERQANALARTNDPQTSKDAAVKLVKSGELSRQENEVYQSIKSRAETFRLAHEPEDFTTKDIAKFMYVIPQTYDKAYDICRKRFSGLRDKGKIERIQRTVDLGGKPYKVHNVITHRPAWERRDGCCVWRLL